MINYGLTKIATRDNVILDGLYHEPVKRGTTALLWIHGFTGTFYGDTPLFSEICKQGDPSGFGFASFNTRGHDCIASLSTLDQKSKTGFGHAMGGAGYENFGECAFDIDAGITFLAKRGFANIVLVGHSTGANKACYYAGTQNDTRVAAVVLAGPLSDRLAENPVHLERMRELVADGKENELVTDAMFMPITPDRYLSLYTPGSPEDVFDYGEKLPKMRIFRRIAKPVLVLLGEKDEHADRPVSEIKRVFDSRHMARQYESVIIPGANHGFDGKENETASAIVGWVRSVLKE